MNDCFGSLDEDKIRFESQETFITYGFGYLEYYRSLAKFYFEETLRVMDMIGFCVC